MLAVSKRRQYIQGQHFIIRTDQQSLKYILEQKIEIILQQRWISKLLGLDYEVQYKKGTGNRAADALSRREHLEEYSSSKGGLKDTYPEYSILNGMIRKGTRVCVGKQEDLRKHIIQVLHNSTVGGHSGIQGTYQRVKSLFYWVELKRDVMEWVSQCDICQGAKHENIPYPGLLQPLQIPQQAWSHITMDFIEGLPRSEGKNCILGVVDRLTKYAHFLPLTHPFSAEQVAKVFLDNVYKLHGLPLT
ncbi:UNVERIFIED_CONTAM: Transposon Tf2-11 polyprotein [Sesamum radiatum]|uniref:Transposon Tf2-11 polyprotein n=1 Tax=Sesamum radiatum TaxID=300843 RepID=A0AAW2R0D7_SESRA